MANEWSKIFDGATVATKIEFLQAQTKKEGGSVFFAQKGNKNWNGNKTGTNGGRGKSRNLCWNFAKGNCKKGDDCRFRHAKAEDQESKVHVAKDPDLPDEPVSTLFHSMLM